MRFLALDISTKTGYAAFEDDETLVECGLISDPSGQSHFKADCKSWRDLPEGYPNSFMQVAEDIATICLLTYRRLECEFVVIEHTEKGRGRLSQRLLEWINYAVAKEFSKRKIPVTYLLVSDWRKATKCYLKHWPEYKQWNAKVAKLKKKATPTKSGARIAKVDGKIVTKVDQKKLSIILANTAYDLEIKDDNVADAINLGRGALAILFTENGMGEALEPET